MGSREKRRIDCPTKTRDLRNKAPKSTPKKRKKDRRIVIMVLKKRRNDRENGCMGEMNRRC